MIVADQMLLTNYLLISINGLYLIEYDDKLMKCIKFIRRTR